MKTYKDLIDRDEADPEGGSEHNAGKGISRRMFLSRGALAVGAAAAATGGLGVLTRGIAGANTGASTAVYGGTCGTVPGTIRHPRGTWGYPSGGLDPAACAERAYSSYHVGHCAYGVMDGIIGTLQDTLGSPYTNLDLTSFVFLWGGLNGWGTVCGTVAGAALTTNLICGTDASGNDVGMAMSEELMGYYASAVIPSYEPASSMYGGTDPNYLPGGAIPTSIPDTPLCHVSISKWMAVAGVTEFWTEERTERCARLAAQMAQRTTELLNAWNDGTYTYSGAGAGPPFYPSPGIGSSTWHQPAQENCNDCHTPGSV
jgi:hypothetical protein